MAETIKGTVLPETLFKFRDWSNHDHKKLITEQEIYLAQPSSFNDPFDCRIPTRWELLTEKDCFKKNLEIVQIWKNNIPREQQCRIAKNITAQKTLWHPDTNKKEDPKVFDDWDNKMGLITLTSNFKNILMWSHYSNSHTGICVGFSSAKLLSNPAFHFIDKVVYSKEYPLISGNDDIDTRFFKQFFTKADDWLYEDEYRITKNHVKNRVVKLPIETFTRVYIGSRTTKENRADIIKTVKGSIGDIPIYQAYTTEYKYELGFELIAN